MLPATSVVVIEANSLLRDGLRHILSAHSFLVVASAGAVEDSYELNPSCEPALVVLGASESHADTARELEACRRRFPSARLLVLDDSAAPDAAAAFRAGANSYLLKSTAIEALVKSVHFIVAGGTVVPKELVGPTTPALPVELLADHDCRQSFANEANAHTTLPDSRAHSSEVFSQKLSNREVEILRSLVAGLPNKKIARDFAIAEATVKVHIKAILRKIRVENRTQAAVWAHVNLPEPIPAETEQVVIEQSPEVNETVLLIDVDPNLGKKARDSSAVETASARVPPATRSPRGQRSQPVSLPQIGFADVA